MRPAHTLLCLSLALAGCAAPGDGPDVPPQSATLLWGPRDLDEAWSPGDAQHVYGVALEVHAPDGGRGFELGALRGVDEGRGNLDTQLDEFFVGTHVASRPLPVGAGALLLWGGTGPTWLRGETDDGDDDRVGFYAWFGARAWLGGGTSVGLAFRWVAGPDLDVAGESLDPSYTQGLLGFTWHF